MTVTSEVGVQVETTATSLGEVVSGSQMIALPLNGRSYTDLLALQPGVSPVSTLLPSSVIMASVTGSIDPSGDLNPGNLSINGQRESSNGFLVNGIDVQEHMKYLPGSLKINTNGRNRRAAFNTSLFPEETLGQLGKAKRRIFYGPGIENFDMTLQKGLRLSDAKFLDLRVEAFNVFNHAQFYGPASVDGQREDPSFGQIESASAPRLVQLAAKFSF